MCIIIDTDSLANVFKTDSQMHPEFKPVLEWILKGKGKVVYGGSKYEKELAKAKNYLKIFAELTKFRKTAYFEKNVVDKEQNLVEKLKSHKDFDDPHLVAIVRASRCKLICTNERRSNKFLTDKKFYSKCDGVSVPKLYKRHTHNKLLNDKNLANCCLPFNKLTKKEYNAMLSALP